MLMSIVVHGRNDSYMHNFLWRCRTALTKFGRGLDALGCDDVEIILLDWGSEHNLLSAIDPEPALRKRLRHIHVPPAVARSCDKDAGYAGVVAVNVAARRAAGRYLFLCDSDTYCQPDTLARLVAAVRQERLGANDLRRHFFWASRYHIPKTFHLPGPSLEAIDAYLATNPTLAHDRVDKHNFVGAAGALLVHADMWHSCRGLDERLIYWGSNDLDLHFRLCMRYGWGDLEDHGLILYHLEHYFTRSLTESGKKANPPFVMPTQHTANDANWGLADHTFPETNPFR